MTGQDRTGQRARNKRTAMLCVARFLKVDLILVWWSRLERSGATGVGAKGGASPGKVAGCSRWWGK